MKPKKVIRGKRPHHVQIPKLIDKFTVNHLATFPLPRLKMLLEVVENEDTQSKIIEAINLIQSDR